MLSRLEDTKKQKSILEFNRHYLAKVVDNNDPLKIGRVRFRIQGIHRRIPDAKLPWAMPVKNSVQGNNNVGSINIPVLGSEIIVYFIDEYTPLILGEINRSSSIITELTDINYPDCYGFVDKGGNKFFVNTVTDEVSFVHLSGTTIQINQQGECSIKTASNLNLESQGSINISAKENVIIDCKSLQTNVNELQLKSNTSTLLSSLGATTVSGANVILASAAGMIVNAATFIVNALFGPWLPINGWAVQGNATPGTPIGSPPTPPTAPTARNKPTIEPFTDKLNY